MTRQQLELYRRAKREARRLVQAGLDARRASRQQQRLLAARGVGGRRTAELATWAARAARAAGALEQQLEEAECPACKARYQVRGGEVIEQTPPAVAGEGQGA